MLCSGGGSHKWEIGFRRDLRTFEQQSLDELRAAPGDVPIYRDEEDEIIWTGDASGLFSVKIGVEVALKDPLDYPSVGVLAWLGGAPRVQMFVWCILKKKILTRMELNLRGILSSSDNLFFTLCGDLEEDVDHLFWKMSSSKRYFGLGLPI